MNRFDWRIPPFFKVIACLFKQSSLFYCIPLSATFNFGHHTCTPSRGGGYYCQCWNSMNAYSDLENVWCIRVETFINTLYDDEGNIDYACPDFVRSVPVSWTQQTAGVHACGLHVLSHIYLTSKGLAHTHTFDNVFVEKMRKYCVQSLYENRCNRRTTYMRPIDLTQDNPDPRFKLL